MGQIVGGAAKPKRCNLNKLSQLETPAAGEYILVSSDNSMNADGQGDFDCYIVGDGRTAANLLELQFIDKNKRKEVTTAVCTTFYHSYLSYGTSSQIKTDANQWVSDKISLKNGFVTHYKGSKALNSNVFNVYDVDDNLVATSVGEPGAGSSGAYNFDVVINHNRYITMGASYFIVCFYGTLTDLYDIQNTAEENNSLAHDYIDYDFTKGFEIKAFTGVVNSRNNCIITNNIPIKAGDYFVFTSKPYNMAAWAIYDEQENVIAVDPRSHNSTVTQNDVLRIPKNVIERGATYIRFSSDSNNATIAIKKYSQIEISEAVEKINYSVQDAIVNGDNPVKINITGYTSVQEASLIKYNGETILYYTAGTNASGTYKEIICGRTYNPETNTLGEEKVIFDDTIFPNQTYIKCSYFFVCNDAVYCVLSLKPSKKCVLAKSLDGFTFTIVSSDFLNGIQGLPTYASIGNHCILNIKVGDYYYWFIELDHSGWKTYLLKSEGIESGWQFVGQVQGLSDAGMNGGLKAYYKDGIFRMIYHYSTSGQLPTFLGYAEADINNPLYFKRFYSPLLNITRIPEGLNGACQQIADPELSEIDGKTYLIATYVNNSNPVLAEIWKWDCYGRLYSIFDRNI